MSQAKAIGDFWSWFVANAPRFDNLRAASRDELLDEVVQHLHAIDDGLFFAMSEPDKGVSDLIITAEGDQELFPLVHRIIESAPKLDGWTFTPLKPPAGFEFKMQYGDIELDPANLWFMPLVSDDDDTLGLRIAIPDLDPDAEEQAVEAAWILLDTGLGERVVGESIEHVEVAALPHHPEGEGYLQLSELPEYLTWRDARKRK